jgi:hypothetical protein
MGDLFVEIAGINQVAPHGLFEKVGHRHASLRSGALDCPLGVGGTSIKSSIGL